MFTLTETHLVHSFTSEPRNYTSLCLQTFATDLDAMTCLISKQCHDMLDFKTKSLSSGPSSVIERHSSKQQHRCVVNLGVARTIESSCIAVALHFNIQFPTQIAKKGSVPWCCKLHASHRSRRNHPQRYNEPNSLVTSTTSCTNLLRTRTMQCKECVLRSLRPRLLRLTCKQHCRIDMQTEQWSSLWTYQFPHNAPNEPSSTRPSTDALASIFTLNLWQFHVVR